MREVLDRAVTASLALAIEHAIVQTFAVAVLQQRKEEKKLARLQNHTKPYASVGRSITFARQK